MDSEFYDSDEHLTFDELDTKLKLVVDTDKASFNRLIENDADDLIKGIEKRKELSNTKKTPFIKYILKKSSEYDIDTLFSYELEDVMKIYFEVKELNLPMWKKILRFLS